MHHVLLRGIERQRIFRDDVDRKEFVARLTRVLPECGTACFAWALLSNHVHLLLQTGERPLSEAMARINTGHAVVFNRRHRRSGYLFQNRYKALLVHDDAYLFAALRYIHLNPLRAGIVSSLAQLARYPWTGHATLMGRAAANFQRCEPILEHFGTTPRDARTRLHVWMGEADATGGDPRAETALPEARVPAQKLLSRSDTARLPRAGPPPQAKTSAAPESEGKRLQLAVREVCRHFDVDTEDLRGRARGRVSEARAALAYLACVKLRVRAVRVARWLDLSESTVSRACARGRRTARDGPDAPWHRTLEF